MAFVWLDCARYVLRLAEFPDVKLIANILFKQPRAVK